MLAFLKNLPVIIGAIQALYNMYEKWKRLQIETKFKKIKKTRSKVISEIEKVTSDEERAELIKRLNNIG